jgi:serine/threonine protein kinase
MQPGSLMPSQFGRYQVIRKLGQGAMSSVFLARDPFLSRLVAVKVLHPDLLFQEPVLARFFKEAKAVSRIHSPNVVSIFDFGMEGRVPYLVLEFIDGQTLQKIMDHLQGEPMDPIVACALIAQVLEGLGAASERGIVHRDLKPENLMLTRKGQLKITDFGICHLKDHTMTVTGQMLGSPRFMSPEQVDGIKPLSIQSDLFSLGGVFYYLLAGVPPFAGDSLPDLYRQILFEPHRPLSEVRPGLDRSLTRLVDALLEKDPARRGRGPSAVSLHLKEFLLKWNGVSQTDRIGEYLRELNAAGFQTPSHFNPDSVQKWISGLELGTLPIPISWRWKKVEVAISILVLGLAAGLIYLLPRYWEKSLPVFEPLASEPKEVFFEAQPGPLTRGRQQPMPVSIGARVKVAPESIPSGDAFPGIESPKPDTPNSSVSEGEALLTIQSVPPFAEVSLDGSPLGRTPMENKPIPAGTYRLTLRPKFGDGVDTLVQIYPGIQSLKFVLMENPVSEDSH